MQVDRPYRRGDEPVTYDGLAAELANLELRLDRRAAAAEKNQLTEVQVREMIGNALQASEARGWTSRERMMGLVLVLVAVVTLALNVYTATHAP